MSRRVQPCGEVSSTPITGVDEMIAMEHDIKLGPAAASYIRLLLVLGLRSPMGAERHWWNLFRRALTALAMWTVVVLQLWTIGSIPFDNFYFASVVIVLTVMAAMLYTLQLEKSFRNRDNLLLAIRVSIGDSEEAASVAERFIANSRRPSVIFTAIGFLTFVVPINFNVPELHPLFMTTFPLMQNVALGVFSSLIMGVFMIPTLQTSMTSPCIFNVILMNRLRALDALVRTGLKGSMTTKRWNELIGEIGREYSRIHGACEMVNAENSSLLLIMLVGGGANIIFVLRTLLLVTLPANVISVMVFFMLISLRLMLSVATTSATVDSRSHRVASSISRLDPGADQSHLDVIDDHERVEVLLIHRRIQSMLHRYEYAPINIQIYHLLAITWGLVAEITSIAFTALIVLYNLSTGTRIEGA